MAEPEIFISYRRNDSAGHARALHRDLCRRFDVERIYFDRESIDAGIVFTPQVLAAVGSCRVALVLIGPGWLDAVDAAGRRRLDLEDDLVRQEVALALTGGKHVVPLLFDDTTVPPADRLPAPLQPLAGRDAHALRGKNYEYDVQLERLVALIAAVPGVPAPLPAGVVVERGAEFDVYRGLHYVPIRLRAPLRAVFKPLIEDRTRVFAGRRDALARLMAFAAGQEGGYLVVTAPPGFGKTALLASLVAATPEAFAYHFFAPLYGEETLDEKFFLQNVLQQMAAWHDHVAELPEAVNELRALYQQFVDAPLPHAQVLVLDGLDEVSAWRLSAYLSRRLPPRLHFIVSVRDVGQDWRADYELPADQTRRVALDGLDAAAIRELLAGLGGAAAEVARDDKAIERIVEMAAYEGDPATGADPFYIRFLAEDLASAAVAPHEILHQPKGLDAWLDRWWQQLVQRAGDTPVRDLFGTLAAALAPIGRAELEAINPSLKDDWAGDFFDRVIAPVRRLVRRDDADRYAIAHPRLRRYVADPRRIGRIEQYRERLVAYCADWASHPTPYALGSYAAHLVEAGRLAELAALFSPSWIATQWGVLRTYAPLVNDLDRLARGLFSAADSAPDAGGASPAAGWATSVACACAASVARQTVRELMAGIPSELLRAWARSGQAARALEVLAAQGSGRPWSLEQRTQLAEALLQSGDQAWSDAAARLLAQALDLLPLQKSTLHTVDGVAHIARQLVAGRGLPDEERATLTRQLAAFVDTIGDAVARPAALATMASALHESVPDQEAARGWLRQALEAVHSLPLPADRCDVLARGLQALQAAGASTAVDELARLLALGAPAIEHGSLVKNPLIRALEAWHPAQADAVTLELVDRAAALYLNPEVSDFAGAALAALIGHLLRLQRVDDGLALLDHAHAASADEAIRAAVDLIDKMPEVWPTPLLETWLGRARGFTDPARHEIARNREMFTAAVANAFARCERWEDAFELSRTLRPHGRLEHLRTLLETARRLADPTTREALTERVLALGEESAGPAEQRELAALYAIAAGDAAPRLAAQRLARAAAACLAAPPEGSTDALRALEAAAWHDAGDPAAAVKSVERMRWERARMLADLVRRAPAGSQAEAQYVDALLACVRAPAAEPAFAAVLEGATAVAECLGRRGDDRAVEVAEAVRARIDEVDVDAALRLLARLAAGGAHRAPPSAQGLFAKLSSGVREAQRAAELERLARVVDDLIDAHGTSVSPAAIADLHRTVAREANAGMPVGSGLRDALAALARRVSGSGPDGFTVRSAAAAVAAATGADPALTRLAALLPEVGTFAADAGARYLRRLIADMTGLRMGANKDQAAAVEALALDLALAAAAPGLEAGRVSVLLDALVAVAAEIEDPQDRVQALVDMARAIASGPEALADRLAQRLAAAVVDPGIEAARRRQLTRDLVQAYDDAGRIEFAGAFAGDVADAETADEFNKALARARRRAALGDTGAFGAQLLGGHTAALGLEVLHTVRVEGQTREMLLMLGELIVANERNQDRSSLLSDLATMVAVPLLQAGGASAIGAFADEIERYDAMLLDAAELVRAAPGS